MTALSFHRLGYIPHPTYINIIVYFHLLQSVSNAGATVVICRTVLHDCIVLKFGSFSILDCMVASFEHRVPSSCARVVIGVALFITTDFPNTSKVYKWTFPFTQINWIQSTLACFYRLTHKQHLKLIHASNCWQMIKGNFP